MPETTFTDEAPSPGPAVPLPVAPVPQPALPTPSPPYRPRWRLAAVLLLLTFLTTTTLGGVVYVMTRTDESTALLPFLHPQTLREVWTTPALLKLGLSFSIPLLIILGSHELGHYLACRRYRVPATVPYFLPAPLGIGTFGAFIRIRARVASKSQLFDIGIAGPIAGFVALLPFLVVGVAWSEPGLVSVTHDPAAVEALLYRPGTNVALYLLTLLVHGRLPANAVLDLHPFALAAWVGLLATALNLLPMGQLDGGHILYAVAGRLHRWIAWPTWILVCALGVLWLGWLVLSLMVLLLMGLRHPPVVDAETPLDPRRRRLALVAWVLLALSFTPVPLATVPLGGGSGVLVERHDAGAAPQRSSTNVTGPSLTRLTFM
jgi:hypothetical protein